MSTLQRIAMSTSQFTKDFLASVDDGEDDPKGSPTPDEDKDD